MDWLYTILRSKLAKLHISLYCLFFDADQGQIILASDRPTLDTNEGQLLIDFAVAILAAIGLSRLELPNVFTEDNK